MRGMRHYIISNAGTRRWPKPDVAQMKLAAYSDPSFPPATFWQIVRHRIARFLRLSKDIEILQYDDETFGAPSSGELKPLSIPEGIRVTTVGWPDPRKP